MIAALILLSAAFPPAAIDTVLSRQDTITLSAPFTGINSIELTQGVLMLDYSGEVAHAWPAMIDDRAVFNTVFSGGNVVEVALEPSGRLVLATISVNDETARVRMAIPPPGPLGSRVMVAVMGTSFCMCSDAHAARCRAAQCNAGATCPGSGGNSCHWTRDNSSGSGVCGSASVGNVAIAMMLLAPLAIMARGRRRTG